LCISWINKRLYINLMFQHRDLCLLFEVQFKAYSSYHVLPSSILSVLLPTCTFVRLSYDCYLISTINIFPDFLFFESCIGGSHNTLSVKREFRENCHRQSHSNNYLNTCKLRPTRCNVP